MTNNLRESVKEIVIRASFTNGYDEYAYDKDYDEDIDELMAIIQQQLDQQDKRLRDHFLYTLKIMSDMVSSVDFSEVDTQERSQIEKE